MAYPGTVLKLGSEGRDVQAIQKRLGVQQTGVLGPTTEEHINGFKRAHGLAPDGLVGPQTWELLFAPAPPPDLGEAALKEALARVGVMEQPRGSNRGPQVDAYNHFAHAPLGSFWCMSFVQFCVGEAAEKLGRPHPIKLTASCSDLYHWARTHGRLVARPAPGDIFLCIGGERGHYHCGYVRKLLPGERFSTVEGNSNDDGSPNGIEVAFRPHGRRLASCHYVRL